MPPPTIDLSNFVATIAAQDHLRHAGLSGFVRRRLRTHLGQACPLCAAPYDLTHSRAATFPVVATLIHPALGGPATPDNTFLCCRRCQQQRAAADLLSLDAITDDLRAQRAAVLLASHNHLLPLSRHTRSSDFTRALARRHLHTRSRVFAAQGEDGPCLIGVSSRFGDTQSTGLSRLLSRLAGGMVHQDRQLTVHQVEDAAFRAVYACPNWTIPNSPPHLGSHSVVKQIPPDALTLLFDAMKSFPVNRPVRGSNWRATAPKSPISV